MTVKKTINWQKVEEAEKGAFSGRKTYLFRVDLKVKPSEKCAKFEVWIPLPINTSYQSCIETKFAGLEPTKILEDSNFKNKVAYWNFPNLGSKTTYQINQESKVWVTPRTAGEIPGNLADYDRTSSDYKLFVKSNPYFNFDDPRIRGLAKRLKGDKKQVFEITCDFYNYVRDNLTYGNPTEGLYSSIDALEMDKVDCGGFDSLLGALYRCVGIPARLLSGFLAGYPGEHYHAWLEFMTPVGEWVPADPSVEHLRLSGRDFKPGGLGRVGNDRIVVSIGSDILLSGKRFPLLQLPVVESLPASSVIVSRIVEALEVK